MIEEDYVDFEIAKLLKDKGFDGKCSRFYMPNGNNRWKYGHYHNFDISKRIDCPTLQMAMKWLRKIHNILLIVDYEYECDTTPYFFKIYRLGENSKPESIAVKSISYDKDNNPIEHIIGYRDWEKSEGDYSTPEEAYNIGIKYCLENLI